ncbi:MULTISPECIES: helix-turn-helix transcriptional regulator [Halomonadaceae]|jgi:hypothetical protein|uniref:MerR family transcriptional regulator n=1 Tax=Halomonas sp. ZM3 TaxID=1250400 RepID=K7SQ25_9GAMM|nr:MULTISPECIES: helix-turn-helix domain-containing protein [unclassified Halomonas]AFW03526.1 MerR family transcriptional regulator [Halomonas sp. ZM3]PKG50352.1 DNA-binding protein [Halomonas sp. MES3-P3E]
MQNNVNDITPEYLTDEQAAFLLGGLSPLTLRNSRVRGVLLGHKAPPWVKLGRLVRYRRRDLLKWAERNAVERRTAQG